MNQHLQNIYLHNTEELLNRYIHGNTRISKLIIVLNYIEPV